MSHNVDNPKVVHHPNREIADIWKSMERLEKKHVREKDRLLKMSELSLILNNYDEIFSDFDPRPYSARALSQDFLGELKRGSIDKDSDPIGILLMIPSSQKDPNKEKLIEQRLHDHFKKHHGITRKLVSRIKKRGGIMVLVGGIIGTFLAMALTLEESQTFYETFAFVLLEPASWFLMWEGMERVFESWQKYKPDLEFYEKMSHAKISFLPY